MSIYAFGDQRFRIASPDGEREIEGFERARRLAHELAPGEAVSR